MPEIETKYSQKSQTGFIDESVRQRIYPYKTYVAIALWSIVRASLFRFSPRHLFFYRNFLLRLFGAKIGSQVQIYPCVRIEYPWNLEIDDYASIGRDACIYNLGMIKIEKLATISQRAHLCGGTHDYRLKNFPLVTMPITVKEGAWIAADAFIGPGITIGQYAVIGARSVVTKDMPEGMICAGNPCRAIKPRIEKNDVEDETENQECITQ